MGVFGERDGAGGEHAVVDDDGGPVGGDDDLDIFDELELGDDGDLKRVLGEEEVVVDFGESEVRAKVGEERGGDEEGNDYDHSGSGNGLDVVRLCS